MRTPPKVTRLTVYGRDRVRMGSKVLSLRVDGELLDRIRQHAAKRGMSVQDYVVRTLIREDFDERFQSSVDETEKLGRVAWIRADQGAGSGACDRKAEEGVDAERRRVTTTRRAGVPDPASPP